MIGEAQRTRQRSETYAGLADIVATTPVLLGTVAAAVYNIDNGSTFEVRAVHACNVTATARSITIHFVEPGGVVGVNNMRANARAVPASGVLDLSDLEGIAIPPGGSIHALADADAAVSFTVTGVRHSGGYAT